MLSLVAGITKRRRKAVFLMGKQMFVHSFGEKNG